jgi:hypothetical protein
MADLFTAKKRLSEALEERETEYWELMKKWYRGKVNLLKIPKYSFYASIKSYPRYPKKTLIRRPDIYWAQRLGCIMIFYLHY